MHSWTHKRELVRGQKSEIWPDTNNTFAVMKPFILCFRWSETYNIAFIRWLIICCHFHCQNFMLSVSFWSFQCRFCVDSDFPPSQPSTESPLHPSITVYYQCYLQACHVTAVISFNTQRKWSLSVCPSFSQLPPSLPLRGKWLCVLPMRLWKSFDMHKHRF